MAILVTRPHPDAATTAAALRAKGFEVLLAPMLRFEPVAFQIDTDSRFEAVIVSSANALRAISENPASAALLDVPLFAVGERTAQAARDNGFTDVTAAGGDAVSLRELIVAQARAKRVKKSGELLYLAAADRARDLGTELGELGFNISTVTVYRMAAASELPPDISAACANGQVEAVLHYSGRSARLSRCGAGCGRGNFRTGLAAVLLFRGGGGNCARRRRHPGCGGACAGRRCHVRGAGAGPAGALRFEAADVR